jgi:MFS family permease
MTATAGGARLAAPRAGNLRPWVVVGQGAAALAVSMGIGRFVYTPILPLMGREAGLAKSFGATLATANYAGYLLGALAGIVGPALVRSTSVMRVALLVSVATLALMPATHDQAVWFVLRFVGGAASALVFMFAVSAMLSHLRHADHRVGWGFGGVGAGIALSGVLVLITGSIWTWSAAWWSSALAALLLSGLAWGLPSPEGEEQATASPNADRVPPVHRWFAAHRVPLRHQIAVVGGFDDGYVLFGRSAPAGGYLAMNANSASLTSSGWVQAMLCGPPSTVTTSTSLIRPGSRAAVAA